MIDYLQWKKQTTKNPATVTNYKRWVERFYSFTKNKYPFTLEDVLRFREFLVTQEYAPKNIQYGMTLLKDYISYQIAIHKFEFPLKLMKIPQERSNSHYAVTYDEYRRMVETLSLSEPQSLQRRLMITLLWETGMRGGELLNLRISDLRERVATINNEKNHRRRIVGWSEQTDKMLKFYLPLRNNLLSKEDYLFVSFKYRPCQRMTTRQLERIVFDVKMNAGIINVVRPHSFRHGFVHRQLKEGKPITTVAQMLGHSSVFNVINYAQLSGIEIREAWETSGTSFKSVY